MSVLFYFSVSCGLVSNIESDLIEIFNMRKQGLASRKSSEMLAQNRNNDFAKSEFPRISS